MSDRPKFRAAGFRTLAVLVLVVGCETPPSPDGGPLPASPLAASAPRAAAAPSAVPSFSGTDLAWVQLSMAMDEAVLPLIGLVPTRSQRPTVRAFAARFQAAHETELARLRELHRRAGLPADNPHRGHAMPGMVTDDQLAQAERARGTGFDRLLLEHLRAHLDQSVRLARSERDSGAEPQVRQLADQIARRSVAQRAELDHLDVR